MRDYGRGPLLADQEPWEEYGRRGRRPGSSGSSGSSGGSAGWRQYGAVLGVGVLLGVAAFFLADQVLGDDESEALAADEPVAEATSDASEPTAPAEPAPSAPQPSVQAPGEPPVRSAVLRGGVLYLQGRVPRQEIADELTAKASQVLGPDRVVSEYTVDPSAPVPSSAPVVVEDRVLFDTNSSTIRRDFYPLLELGVNLLKQFPSASITVIGHTDSRGSVELNRALSQARVDAVVGYMTGRGVPASQIDGEARGESDLLTPESDPRGLAANRRAEFIINGLLGA